MDRYNLEIEKAKEEEQRERMLSYALRMGQMSKNNDTPSEEGN